MSNKRDAVRAIMRSTDDEFAWLLAGQPYIRPLTRQIYAEAVMQGLVRPDKPLADLQLAGRMAHLDRTGLLPRPDPAMQDARVAELLAKYRPGGSR